MFIQYEHDVRSNPRLLMTLPELKGKILACWCGAHQCHTEVLIALVAELVDGDSDEEER